MKKFLVSLLLLIPIITETQTPQFNTTQYRTAFAVETLTISSISLPFTSSVFNPTVTNAVSSTTRADYAYVSVETGCIRYWPNGTAPTTTVGHKACDGNSFNIYGYGNILNTHMIRVTIDAVIQVSYYRFASNQ